MSDPVPTYRGPIFSSFVTTQSRLSSFPELGIWSKDIVELHAKSGLFYLNEKVRCFYCGANIIVIQNFVNHKSSSDCTLVKLNYSTQVKNPKTKCIGLILVCYLNVKNFLQDIVNTTFSKEELKRDVSCKICLVRLAQYVYLPCGRLLTCLECCTTQYSCPLCRQEITSILKVYV